jgi:formylglycine-generating enzyme required for sulfatase activity
MLLGLLSASRVASDPSPLIIEETWVRPADGMMMVYVPGGEFVMGSADHGAYAMQLCKQYFGDCLWDSYGDEGPAHPVALSGFWIDHAEITNGHYRHCVEAGACKPPMQNGSYTRESYYDNRAYDAYPVIYVTWFQAAEYCKWAGGQLPTEAQWEYAARGPDNRIFPWGSTFNGSRVNYCDTNCPLPFADHAVDDGFADTAPVGRYPAGKSWCGVLDMAGNVREWVADWYGFYPRPDKQINPQGPASGTLRGLRGGAWINVPDDIRSVNRGSSDPNAAYHKVGFRCVKMREAEEP